MPIEVDTKLRVLTQPEFHDIDEQVMGVVFEVHNEFGRLLDEVLYKREIAARCEAIGIGPAEREVRIRVSHDNFRKDYFMDLLFCGGAMLEAKTVERLTSVHQTLGYHYLLLAGLHHGKLVNLRSERVEYEFISTKLSPDLRLRFDVVDGSWTAADEESAWFKSKVVELLADWGAFLDFRLYREAVTHFLGGETKVCQPVEVHSGNRVVGQQTMHLLNRETAFAFSAITHHPTAMGQHLRRFLNHTPLKSIQWVNLNHHNIEFVTLRKGG